MQMKWIFDKKWHSHTRSKRQVTFGKKQITFLTVTQQMRRTANEMKWIMSTRLNLIWMHLASLPVQRWVVLISINSLRATFNSNWLKYGEWDGPGKNYIQNTVRNKGIIGGLSICLEKCNHFGAIASKWMRASWDNYLDCVKKKHLTERGSALKHLQITKRIFMIHRLPLCPIRLNTKIFISCQFHFIYWTNQVDNVVYNANPQIQCLKMAFFNNSMLKCFS